MTLWVAQNKHDRTWLMAFESQPTLSDIAAAARHCDVGFRSNWDIYGYHVFATEAGKKRRKRMKEGFQGVG